MNEILSLSELEFLERYKIKIAGKFIQVEEILQADQAAAVIARAVKISQKISEDERRKDIARRADAARRARLQYDRGVTYEKRKI